MASTATPSQAYSTERCLTQLVGAAVGVRNLGHHLIEVEAGRDLARRKFFKAAEPLTDVSSRGDDQVPDSQRVGPGPLLSQAALSSQAGLAGGRSGNPQPPLPRLLLFQRSLSRRLHECPLAD